MSEISRVDTSSHIGVIPMIQVAWKACLYIALMCGLITIPAHASSLSKAVPTGSWGGEHIRLVVTGTGATLEYDCAFGRIDEPLLTDKNGNFEARGIHVFERGGPLEIGEPPPKRLPALYRGWTDGSTMSLTVILLDTGKDVGTFSLGLGRPPRIEKCL
jgi:hypothetical protein